MSGLSFTVHVECAVEDPEGNPIPVYEGDVTVAGDGVPVVATGDRRHPGAAAARRALLGLRGGRRSEPPK